MNNNFSYLKLSNFKGHQMGKRTLLEIYNEVVAEDNSPLKSANRSLAIMRYVRDVVGVTDADALHELVNEMYLLLEDK